MATKSEEGKKGGFAVIETGSKQYVVREGDVITIETLPNIKDDKKVTFESVLLTGEGENIKVGSPMLEKVTVEGELLEEGRGKKVVVMKYKAKSNYFVKNGHRQPFQKVKITKIA